MEGKVRSLILPFSIFNPLSSAFSEPLAQLRQYQPARLLRRQRRIVYHLGAERNHQRGHGPLAVPLVAHRQVFVHAIRGSAGGTFGQRGVEIKFIVRFRKNIRADVAPFHYQVAELDAFALGLFHPRAHFRNCRDVRNGGGGLRRANFFFRKIAVHEQMHRAQAVFLDAFQFRFPFAAKRGDSLRVVDLHALLQAMPR